MVFSEGTEHSLQSIKEVLEEFYIMSGLKVNFSKSEMFCCDVSKRDQYLLANILGLAIGSFPVRYLVFPFISGKLKDSDCQPLIDKITAKVHSWTSKFLSYAGRLQFISSVLEGMYNYWCTVFLLPKKIIRQVERICNAFLWKGKGGSAVRVKVSWGKLCRPKDEGGLGLKRLGDWNKACLARIIWMLFRGSDTL